MKLQKCTAVIGTKETQILNGHWAPRSGFAMNCLALFGPEQECSSLLLTQHPHEDDCCVRLGVLGFIV